MAKIEKERTNDSFAKPDGNSFLWVAFVLVLFLLNLCGLALSFFDVLNIDSLGYDLFAKLGTAWCGMFVVCLGIFVCSVSLSKFGLARVSGILLPVCGMAAVFNFFVFAKIVASI